MSTSPATPTANVYPAASFFQKLSMAWKPIGFREIIFRSGGDSIFRGTIPEGLAADDTSVLAGLPVYAVSDGTAPNQCEDGPYIIDEEHARRNPILLVRGVHGDAIGQFRYWLKGKPVTVRMSIGVTRELARIFNVDTFRMEFDVSVRRGPKSSPYVEESFALVGKLQ